MLRFNETAVFGKWTVSIKVKTPNLFKLFYYLMEGYEIFFYEIIKVTFLL